MFRCVQFSGVWCLGQGYLCQCINVLLVTEEGVDKGNITITILFILIIRIFLKQKFVFILMKFSLLLFFNFMDPSCGIIPKNSYQALGPIDFLLCVLLQGLVSV